MFNGCGGRSVSSSRGFRCTSCCTSGSPFSTEEWFVVEDSHLLDSAAALEAKASEHAAALQAQDAEHATALRAKDAEHAAALRAKDAEHAAALRARDQARAHIRSEQLQERAHARFQAQAVAETAKPLIQGMHA